MSENKEPSQKRAWRGTFSRARGKRRMSAARRRLLVRAGIVALVFTAVVIVPAYISLQPRFLQRYPNLNPEYRTWSTSVHAKVRCQACHVPPELTAQSAYGVRMLGEFYLSAVLRSRELKILSTPTNAACSSCHIDLRTVSPSGDLNIPHRAHVGVLKLKCVRCHEYLVHEKSPEGKHAPRMTGCLTCHDGRQAKNACSTCHTDKGAPVSHRSPEWVVVHPLKQKNLDCKKCHAWTGNWCAECHSRRPKSHVAKWRSKHPLQVKARRNCEACHEAPFCIRCHGEVPQLNFNPALKLVE